MHTHDVVHPFGRLVRRAAWACAAAVFASALPAQAEPATAQPVRSRPAQEEPVPARPVQTAALDRLAERAARLGTVRVLVGVPVEVRPEGRLAASAVPVQRKRIRAAQQLAIAELAGVPGARVGAVFERVPHFVAELDANALARLRRSPSVRSIEEDVAVPATLLQSAPAIGADAAWAGGRTGEGWTIAVLDTGVDKTHPFLAGKVVSEACYSSTVGTTSYSVCPGGVSSSTAPGSGVNCSSAVGGCQHGTHVAGIVAGTGAVDGSQGVAPGAGIIAIQVFSRFAAQNTVMSYSSDQIRALERVYALKDSFRIAAVNMSLGGSQHAAACDGQNTALKAAIDNLRSVGIATVISSGNDGARNAIAAPACISSAVSVGATCDAGPDGGTCATGVGGVASYSNIAPFVSLLAPGSYVGSSVPGGGYAAWNGTSMAAPHVAGAWALLKQAQPEIGVGDALALLRENATPVADTRSGGSAGDLRRVQLGFLSGPSFRLRVTKSGTGTVASQPVGLTCGGTCSRSFAEGTTVTLNPTAGPYAVFGGWTGDCSGSGACTLTMSADHEVGATFVATTFALGVTRAGTGSGSVAASTVGLDCGSTCSVPAAGGTSVALTATPAAGSRFAGWSGACTGTAATCTVSMTGPRAVTASFVPLNFTVGVTRSGSGGGTVVSAAGIACGSTCAVTKPYGSALTLSATPVAGSAFAGWSGACTGTGPCTLTVAGPTAVGAQFVRTHWPLTVTKTGTGAVGSSMAGLDCGSVCSALMPVDAEVVLTARPGAGQLLAAWGGACSGSAETCSVTMSAARAVTAAFAPIQHALTVAPAGDGVGSVTSAPAGVACGTACTKSFVQGATVTLTARAAAGSVFSGWSGACAGSAATCAVTMAEARSVGASFTRTHWTLAATKTGSGAGSVASTPAAIACGTTCSALVPVGTAATLTAVAAPESAFGGWSGACAGTHTGCALTMDAAKTAVATFTRTHFTLSVARTGNGAGGVAAGDGSIDCGANCSRSIPVGTVVTLTATPATGTRFAGWTGACAGTAPTCTVTMSAARTVSAAFALLSYPVAVARSGSGAGSVASAPAGLACGSVCSVPKTYGSSLTLTATPAAGSAFAGWSGPCTGTGPCVVTVTQATTVGAEFTRTHWPLAVTRGGSGAGSVGSDPAGIACGSVCSQLRPVGEAVALTATPAPESAFAGWSGACAGTGPCALTMDAARTVGATFTRTHWTLTVNRAGAGAGQVSAPTVELDCGAVCSRSVPVGRSVTLTATAAPNARFTGWSGACAGTGATCTVAMTAARSVTATFQPILYAVSVTKTGSGSVTSSPAAIACGATCTRTVVSGTTLTLSAMPAAGWRFDGWGGACEGAGACALTVDGAKAVSARFVTP